MLGAPYVRLKLSRHHRALDIELLCLAIQILFASSSKSELFFPVATSRWSPLGNRTTYTDQQPLRPWPSAHV